MSHMSEFLGFGEEPPMMYNAEVQYKNTDGGFVIQDGINVQSHFYDIFEEFIREDPCSNGYHENHSIFESIKKEFAPPPPMPEASPSMPIKHEVMPVTPVPINHIHKSQEEPVKIEKTEEKNPKVVITRLRSSVFMHYYRMKYKVGYECAICTKSFARKQDLTIHRQTAHYKPRPFQCTDCDKSFCDKTHLWRHSKHIHKSDMPVFCEDCGSRFADHRYLKIHVKEEHKKQAKYRCRFCIEEFSVYSGLTKHIRQYHKSTLARKCEHCGKILFGKSSLESHIKHVHHKVKVICALCNKPLRSKSNLLNHLNSVHKRSEAIIECTRCLKNFSTSNSLKSHVFAVHFGIKKHLCHTCDVAFSKRDHLERHVESKHPATVHGRSLRFACDTCNSAYSKKRALRDHVIFAHLKMYHYICRYCKRPISSAANLETHVEAFHVANKMFPCLECFKNFESPSDLETHGCPSAAS